MGFIPLIGQRFLMPVFKPWLRNFADSMVAVLAGNVAYFLLMPHFPYAARHVPFRTDLGLLVDGCFCLVAFGVVKLVRNRRRDSKTLKP